MRQKRAKAYRKLMHLYCMSFGFRQPYQVLVDAEICRTAISQNIDLSKQLGLVVQGDVKPMITQCCIHELYLEGKSVQPAVDLAKSFERRKCNHREPIPGQDCLESVIGETNKHRYVIASQVHELRVKLRQIPATPLIHINRSVVILEPPSDATLKLKEANEEKALHAKPTDVTITESTQEKRVVKKRKGPKGPNPLSVKKKKTAPLQPLVKARPTPVVGSKRKAEESEDEGSQEGQREQSTNIEETKLQNGASAGERFIKMPA